jgi:hypothetical protein
MRVLKHSGRVLLEHVENGGMDRTRTMKKYYQTGKGFIEDKVRALFPKLNESYREEYCLF